MEWSSFSNVLCFKKKKTNQRRERDPTQSAESQTITVTSTLHIKTNERTIGETPTPNDQNPVRISLTFAPEGSSHPRPEIPQLKNHRSERTPDRERQRGRNREMAMARASSGLQYPERFYAAASYAGFDGDANSTFKALTSKFSKESAAILYGLYQQVPSPYCRHHQSVVLAFVYSIHHRSGAFRFKHALFGFYVLRSMGNVNVAVCIARRFGVVWWWFDFYSVIGTLIRFFRLILRFCSA